MNSCVSTFVSDIVEFLLLVQIAERKSGLGGYYIVAKLDVCELEKDSMGFHDSWVPHDFLVPYGSLGVECHKWSVELGRC